MEVSEYCAVSIGLQDRCKPVHVELFKAYMSGLGSGGVVTAMVLGWRGLCLVLGPNVIYFHGAQNPWRRPCPHGHYIDITEDYLSVIIVLVFSESTHS